MKKTITYLAILALALAGCKKDNNQTKKTVSQNAIAPAGFNFATAQDIAVNLSLKAPNNDALQGVIVRFYSPADTALSDPLFTAATDKGGNLTTTIHLPTYMTQLVIKPGYLGLPGALTANINNKQITATIGGKGGYSGDIQTPVTSSVIKPYNSRLRLNSLGVNTISGPTDFEFPSPYTSVTSAVLNTTAYPLAAGRPAYISSTPNVVDAVTLSYINSSLPEAKSVSVYNPQYISAVNTINVVNTTNVSITFITGIAKYLSTLAYYTYPTSNPPQSVNDIKNATYIFPNTSNFYGLPQYLQPGDNINLGSFAPGTSIGFILIANAWTGSSIDLTQNKWYTQDALNSDGTRHCVELYDALHQVSYIGFEDEPSTYFPYYDDDCNDAVFSVGSSVTGAISHVGVAPVNTGTDTDGDGVPDALDAYPTDPTRAYNNYFPSQNTYAQIAFEDNWPNKGDYDMNDLVVNYRYKFVSNAQNQIVTMQGNYSVAAAGASFKNGFGVQLPVSAGSVKSVTGQQFISSYISLASNGVEAGQTKAVIIPFDNYNALINNPNGAYFINTLMSLNKVTSSADSVLVTFNSPVDPSVLTVSALNPFLISNLRRGYEVHLPNYQPTDLANKALFKTGDDASSIASGITYISTDNWPWAISYNGIFNYPIETVNVSLAYPHFLDWTSSGGTLFTDWYTNLSAGYRNNSDIYSK